MKLDRCYKQNTPETTPQQQNTNATTVQAPHTADSVQQQPILDRDFSQTSTLFSDQPRSSAQQTLEDQNFSDSRDTHQEVPQTGFEIHRPTLQQTEHVTTNPSLSFNIVTKQQFIPKADSQTSSNGQSRTNYILMTRTPIIKKRDFRREFNEMEHVVWTLRSNNPQSTHLGGRKDDSSADFNDWKSKSSY